MKITVKELKDLLDKCPDDYVINFHPGGTDAFDSLDLDNTAKEVDIWLYY